jgi:hypothetical protein
MKIFFEFMSKRCNLEKYIEKLKFFPGNLLNIFKEIDTHKNTKQ